MGFRTSCLELSCKTELASHVFFQAKLNQTPFYPLSPTRCPQPTTILTPPSRQQVIRGGISRRKTKKTPVLTGRFSKSSPISKYRLNFLSAPLAIYSRVSATLHGCQQPKMQRLFLWAMLPACFPPTPQTPPRWRTFKPYSVRFTARLNSGAR